MTDPDALPEPDRAGDAPHPRETGRLLGQIPAETTFLDAYRSGRMHHAWLITGPRGVGKATLAWRLARFLLATPQGDGGMFAPDPPQTLDIDPGHPVAHRLRALSDPGLFLLRRGWDDKKKRLKKDITVDEARRLRGFFSLTAGGNGRRVVIVDAADELNDNAANAILKLLEEPPAHATFLIVAHQPARLLPTIRSRCRELRLSPLAPDALADALAAAGAQVPEDTRALTELAAGSVGEALRLTNEDGLGLYAELVAILADAPRFDRARAIKLAESTTGAAKSARFDLILHLADLLMSRLARAGAGAVLTEAAPGEAALIARLSPGPHAARAWASTQQALSARAAHGRAVNLDPAALILDMVIRINETAAREAA